MKLAGRLQVLIREPDRPKRAASAAAAVLSILFLGASPASASYLFDATLSLKGDCSASAPDTIPDPPVEECESGEHPPSGPFFNSQGIATDLYGNVYVSSYGSEGDGSEGRVDIFDSAGFFVSELLIPNGPQNIAVDSQGNLYVRENPNITDLPRKLSRYAPTVYEPEAGNIEYGPTPTVVANTTEPFLLPFSNGIAINPANDHVFMHYENKVVEFNSAEDGNELVDATIGAGTLQGGKWVAVDAARDRVYASDSNSISSISRVRVFELEAPHALLETIDGSTTPSGSFGTPQGHALVAVDEANGHLLVGDMGQRRVIEFDEDYDYVSTTNKPKLESAEPSQLYVDNGPTSPNQGYFFINSGFGGTNNAYAFEPLEEPEAPEVESIAAGEISETDAELRATINSNSAATEYTFELTSAEDTEFSSAIAVGEGQIEVGNEGVEVSAGANGLSPGTAYRFRVIAVNEKGQGEDEATFSTYAGVGPLTPCANETLRTGPSVLLPDCRAYELVTPPDTGGRVPKGPGSSLRGTFPSFAAAPLGNRISFLISGGALPGAEGTGAFTGQNYGSLRGAAGWETDVAGPNGSESMSAVPGGVSPDQGFSFWSTGAGADEGTARIDGLITNYVRYPDGHSELIGRGSLGTDPQARGKLLTEDGAHIIFETVDSSLQEAQQLEPNAPPEGTATVYDRARDPVTGVETTHVVSLLPGDITPAAGQNAIYVGASLDGEGIAFEIGSALYLRSDNEETYEVGTGVDFAGVAEGGERVFYVEGDDLLALDVSGEEEEVVEFTTTGDATVVNVATEGTRAYFTSPSVLGGQNPEGDVAQPGEQNLYLSEEGAISFVGTVTDRDVEGEVPAANAIDGLGLWAESIEVGWAGDDPSRTTPDGSVLLFQSRADLTGFESDEHVQVFRYDFVEDRLHCISCNPTGAKPVSGASLESLRLTDPSAPLNDAALVRNLRTAGDRAFFQTAEPLVSYDSDGFQDVYEWEEEGVGTCQKEGGCTYLITSGGSARNDYLFAVSESGNDIFFTTADQLLPIDGEPIYSIYDARVGGGFAEPPLKTCSGEGCRPGLTPPPPLPKTQSHPPAASPVVPRRKCPKGKRKVKRHGKVVCVKKKNRRHHKGRNK